MAPPDRVPSATVTDLATARDNRTRDAAARGAAPRDASATKASAAKADAAKTTAASGGAAKNGRKPANRRFDTEKVERLKAAIAEGRYTIDAASVADRFIEHERNS